MVTFALLGGIGGASYKAESKMEYTQTKKAMSGEIIRQSDNKKIIGFDTSLLRGQQFDAHFIVSIHPYVSNVINAYHKKCTIDILMVVLLILRTVSCREIEGILIPPNWAKN